MLKKLYSIHTMYKRTLDLLILFGLFVLPLIHLSIEDSLASRTMWSWLITITSILVLFFSTYHFRVQRFSSGILLPLSTLVASSFLFAPYPSQALGIYLASICILVSFAFIQISARSKKVFAAFLICALTLYAQWGIAQFIVQHDLGMQRIGESVLNTTIPGVASFYVGSEKFIRAYGPFGHSNSFAGALLLGIIILYRYKSKLMSPLFVYSTMFVLTLGIIVSFSRTALMGLLIIAILSGLKRNWVTLSPIIIGFFLFIPLLLSRSLDTHGAAAHERLLGLEWFTNIVTIESLVRGFGIGNYTHVLTEYLQNNFITHNPWDIAPIHSAPLLLIAELGILISIPLFVFILRFIMRNRLWFLIALLPSLMLDHYFATQLSPLVLLITTTHLVVQ